MASKKPVITAAIGGILGALLFGPLGAAVGAGAGVWIGSKV